MRPSTRGHVIAFLFIICSNFLSRLLTREEKKNYLDRIKEGIVVPIVSHVLYANDLLISSRANDQDVAFAMACFG